MSCKDCTKRHIGCHAKCEKYKQDQEKRRKEKEQIKKAKDHDNMLNGYEWERINRAKKKKGELK